MIIITCLVYTCFFSFLERGLGVKEGIKEGMAVAVCLSPWRLPWDGNMFLYIQDVIFQFSMLLPQQFFDINKNTTPQWLLGSPRSFPQFPWLFDVGNVSEALSEESWSQEVTMVDGLFWSNYSDLTRPGPPKGSV